MAAKSDYTYATGRRKESSARVYIKPAAEEGGAAQVNGLSLIHI